MPQNISFNITFFCENGHFKLEQCTKLLSLDDLKEHLEVFEAVGLGRLDQIVIDF